MFCLYSSSILFCVGIELIPYLYYALLWPIGLILLVEGSELVIESILSSAVITRIVYYLHSINKGIYVAGVISFCRRP